MDLILLNIISQKLYECVADSGCYAIVTGHRYSAIVSNNKPRWIIPLGSPLAKEILTQWMPYGKLTNIKWRIICWLSPFKVVEKLPNVVEVDGLSVYDFQNNTAIKNGVAIKSVIPVVYIGTQGLQQKAVAALICTKTSRNIAIMKIAIGTAASSSLNNEAIALRTLAEYGFDHAPKFISHNQALGYTVQSVIYGKLSTRLLTAAHIDLLIGLAAVSPKKQTTSLAIKKELLVKLNIAQTNSDNFLSKNDFTLITKILKSKGDNFKLPLIFVHADFSPWNIKVTSADTKNSLDRDNGQNSHLALIDWEDFKFSGLPLWDLCHFCFMQSHLFNETKWIKCLVDSPLINQYLKALFLRVENKRTLI